MLVLFIYIFWSMLYIVNLIFFKLFFLKKIFNKQSKVIKLLLVFFFNQNLSFYKNELTLKEEFEIFNIRWKNYYLLNLIHNKINFIFLKKNKNKINFKDNYKLYKLAYNYNLMFNFNFIENNNQLNYSIIQNILLNNLNNIAYNKYFILILNAFKNSFSLSKFNINVIYLKKFNNNLATSLLNNKLNINSIFIFKKTKNYINNLKNNISFININENFYNSIKNLFTVKFSSTNIVKYLSDISINKSTILFLRKNKIFNKSRYSRNRQTYRTGAYWCLYVNIIAVIAFYFWFYNFTMNFGYLWWLLYSFILSFVFFKALKYNLYNPKTMLNEIKNSIKWFYILLASFFKLNLTFINYYLFLEKINFIIILYKNNKNILKLKFFINYLNNLNNNLVNKLI